MCDEQDEKQMPIVKSDAARVARKWCDEDATIDHGNGDLRFVIVKSEKTLWF